MNDLNFFQSYNLKRERKFNKDYLFYGIMGLVIIGIMFYGLFNMMKIKKISKEVAILKQQLEISKSNPKIIEILEKEAKIEELTEKFKHLKSMDDYINSNDLINEYLLDSITERVPETIFLNSIDLNTNTITIDGISKNKKSISDFEHELGEIESFEEVFIPSIFQKDNYFQFTLNVKLREGEVYGN